MIQIDLAAIANQSVSVQLGGSFYELAVRDADGVMSVTITRDGTVVLDGARAVAGSPLIPYNYLEDGNFVFVTENEEYADWRKFGTSHFLLYATADEVAALRATYAVEVVPVANRQQIAAAEPYIGSTVPGFLLINNSGLRLTVSAGGGYLYWRR